MITLNVSNVHSALPEALRLLKTQGVERNSRNGRCRVLPVPVTTVYSHPLERVLFHPARDANPFFHLLEAMGFLVGRDDLDYYAYFAKNMAEFSDDGRTLGASYGVRWRTHFGFDQLRWAINRLKKDPDDRRTVIGMWDPFKDTMSFEGSEKKDVPCNLSALPWVGADGALNLTVFNRSNDSVWGAYGSNAVHFSFLLEYLAAGVGRPVGRYWQVSNNLHIYERHFPLLDSLVTPEHPDDREANPYDRAERLIPLVPARSITNPVAYGIEQLDCDLRTLMRVGPEDERVGYSSPFVSGVVQPAWRAYVFWRDLEPERALEEALAIGSWDWRKACVEWLKRRAR